MREIDEPLSEDELEAFAGDFNHLSSTYASNPYSIYEYMRKKCPMAHSENYGGFWIPSRREDIEAVAQDDDTFTSTEGPSVPKFTQKLHPVDMDPPESVEWRGMLNARLSPKGVTDLEPFIENTVAALVNRFIEEGKADLVVDLARPLTSLTTLKFSGLDFTHCRRISNCIHGGIMGTMDPETYMAEVAWVEAEIQRHIDRVRDNPEEGAISYLVNEARFQGRSLTDEEIIGTVNLFLGGGVDTTQATLGVAYFYLGQHPELKQRLIDEPKLRTTATEEFFRYASPQQSLARTATRDVELGGAQIKKGDQVLLPWGAGNWDPSVFDRPDEFVPDRSPNRHMTFGVGAHRCLGSNLARSMFNTCMNAVLERLPDYKLVEEDVQRAPNCGIVYSFTNTPVAFTPGEKIDTTEASAAEVWYS